jgi:colicin import membrane protein
MNTSRILLWLVMMVMSAAGCAQDNNPVALNAVVERARIAQQRADFEAVFVQKQQGCYARFAVSDCLSRAKRERRVALDELRRQEVVLNDLDRQAKALAELDRIQGNFSPEHQQELELQRQQALQSAQDRQRRSDEKKAARAKPDAVAALVASSTPPAVGLPDALNNQQRYLEKSQEAQQRKTDKAKALSKKSKDSANPLPIPSSQ